MARELAFPNAILALFGWPDKEVRETCFRIYNEYLADVQERSGDRIYGVALGAAFFGESMFSRVRDASKVALATLVERLVAGGFVLLDTQFLTPHLASLGGIEVSRDRYRRMLAQALMLQANFAGPVPGPEAMLAALRGSSLAPSP